MIQIVEIDLREFLYRDTCHRSLRSGAGRGFPVSIVMTPFAASGPDEFRPAAPGADTRAFDLRRNTRGNSPADRKRVVEGKSVAVRVALGGSRTLKKQQTKR